MEHYFWPQVCWSTFPPEYLRINNDDKCYSQSQICKDRRESPNIRKDSKGSIDFFRGQLSSVDTLVIGARLTSTSQDLPDSIGMWALYTNGHDPGHFFCPLLPLSLINLQFWVYHDLQSNDRCPAASFGKEERWKMRTITTIKDQIRLQLLPFKLFAFTNKN